MDWTKDIHPDKSLARSLELFRRSPNRKLLEFLARITCHQAIQAKWVRARQTKIIKKTPSTRFITIDTVGLKLHHGQEREILQSRPGTTYSSISCTNPLTTRQKRQKTRPR